MRRRVDQEARARLNAVEAEVVVTEPDELAGRDVALQLDRAGSLDHRLEKALRHRVLGVALLGRQDQAVDVLAADALGEAAARAKRRLRVREDVEPARDRPVGQGPPRATETK